jgi:protein phosphatase 2C family protein 2/3
MQGWRISMEDAHTTVLDLLAANDADGTNKNGETGEDRLAFFGVFDGHGGDKVALFAGANIHNIVSKQDTFKSGDYAQSLKDGFLATDRAILNGIHPFARRRAQGCPHHP